jgi:hypothetical protein
MAGTRAVSNGVFNTPIPVTGGSAAQVKSEGQPAPSASAGYRPMMTLCTGENIGVGGL